jgi:hypothetical protein
MRLVFFSSSRTVIISHTSVAALDSRELGHSTSFTLLLECYDPTNLSLPIGRLLEIMEEAATLPLKNAGISCCKSSEVSETIFVMMIG